MASEGEFNPNGTWVHALDGPTAGVEAWPACGSRANGVPVPRHALAGRYADSAGRPGNSLVLQFESTADAQNYFNAYQAALGNCPREGTAFLVVTALQPGTDSFVARRRYAAGGVWSEFARVRDSQMLLVILEGEQWSLADLARLAESE